MTVARRASRIRISVLACCAVLLALLALPASPAHADETLTWSVSKVDAAYGTYFQFFVNDSRAATGCTQCEPHVATVTYTGASSGTVTSPFQADGNAGFGTFSWIPPLGTGTYHLIATADVTQDGTAASSAPLTLTIAPAPVAIDVRVAADAANIRNAVISARLTGPIIDDYEAGTTAWGLPAGTWHIGVADHTAASVFSQDVKIAANTVAFANVVWQNVTAGGDFTVSATFVATGSAATDFAVKPAAAVTFSSAPLPTATPSPAPSHVPEAVQPIGPPIPLWMLILLGVLGLAALILLLVALVRRPTSTIRA